MIRSNGRSYPASCKSRGSTIDHSAGYLLVHRPDHPLAQRTGHVLVHRLVLSKRIGLGPTTCHWCGLPLEWLVKGRHRLVVDHLNEDRRDNRPSNLVPACYPCNSYRRKHPGVVERNRRESERMGWRVPNSCIDATFAEADLLATMFGTTRLAFLVRELRRMVREASDTTHPGVNVTP